VPVAAAGLTDIGAADSQPAVAGRVGQHRGEQLAVGGLDRGALGERPLRRGDLAGKRVADLLELTEVEHPRRPGGGGDPVRDADPAEPLDEQPAQLALELADLAAQLGAREALVGSDYERRGPPRRLVLRSRLPIEQNRHRQSLSRFEGRGGNPERLVDGDRRDGADPDRRDRDPAAVAVDPAARPGGAEEEADRLSLVGDRQRPGRQLTRLAGQRLAGRRVADAEPADQPVGVESAQRDAGLDRGDRQRVGRQPTAAEAAVLEAVEDELLDRGAVAIGVQPDLAVENPVGPGDRPAAEADRLGAKEAVGEVAEAAADVVRTAGDPGVDLDRGEREPGELRYQVRRHPTRRRRRLPTDPNTCPFGTRHVSPFPPPASRSEVLPHVG
jgi:hypothetical protein